MRSFILGTGLRIGLRIGLGIGLCAGMCGAVRAQAPNAQGGAALGQRDLEARSLFDAGRLAFDDGRFEDALNAFARSFDLSHRAGLLYNMGQCYDRLRRDNEALDTFKRYLVAQPDAPNAREVRQRIDVLARLVAEREARAPTQANLALQPSAASAPAPVTAAPPLATQGAQEDSSQHDDTQTDRAGTPLTSRWWFWAGTGALVAGGVVLALVLSGSSGTREPAVQGDVGKTVQTLSVSRF